MERRRTAVAAVADLALVAVFVATGRASHREDQSAFAATLWPFAAGLTIGWLAGRVWWRPFALPSGVAAWLGTVAGGMLLRAVAGQGVQVAFVVVASIVTALLLIGWRAALALAVRRAGARGSSAAPTARRAAGGSGPSRS